MDPVNERVAVLVLRVTTGAPRAPNRPGAHIVIASVDRLPPLGDPVQESRREAECVDDAVDIIRAWLQHIVD